MATRIVWRYRRKRHARAAAGSRRQERSFGTLESLTAVGPLAQQPCRKDRPAQVQFQEEEEAQARPQFQEEDEAQPKRQLQEEEEEVQPVVQRQAEEEEEAAQTRVQLQEEEEAQARPARPEPLARRSARLIRTIARSGFRGNPGSYPFRNRIQASFGRHDISRVRAFSDAAATRANRRLGALAYASRERVAFRGYPDLYTAAHEAAHIVQQRRGVRLRGDTGRKGDAYERHADTVAGRVVRGQPVQALLDRPPASDGRNAGLLPPDRSAERDLKRRRRSRSVRPR